MVSLSLVVSVLRRVQSAVGPSRPVAFAVLLMSLPLAALAEPRRVALVFDDGPVPANADPLLVLLAQERVHVTFSLVGVRVLENPATARAIAAAGHEVANHSLTHAPLDKLDAAGVEREVAEGQRELTKVLGRAPRWYWPPFLAVDDRVRAAVERAGLTIYPTPHLVGSQDYDMSVSAEEIYRRSVTDVCDGSVILFHEWRAETRAQLPAILAELRRQGCTFHTFSALLEELAKPAADQAGPVVTP